MLFTTDKSIFFDLSVVKVMKGVYIINIKKIDERKLP